MKRKVVLSKDADHYLHVHPLDESATGPEAKFMTSFPEKGVYKIWGQFQHDNKIIKVPYVVEVNGRTSEQHASTMPRCPSV